ncbi:hypothetical protein OG21DRAFT_1498784 [Imleria badia]|nr:hypothetical protein OG21DRAFT_1498784 [Imleria badia]
MTKVPFRDIHHTEEEYATAVFSKSAWNAGYKEDEESEVRKSPQQQRASMSAGTKAVDPGQQTLVLPDSKRAEVERGTGERSTTSTGSTGDAKPNSITCASMPPLLVTPLHSSASGFGRPFQTPFKTSFRAHSESRDRKRSRSEAEVENPPAPKQEEREDDVEIDDTHVDMDADMEIPEIKMELETQTDAFHALRKSLHRVFPLDAASTDNTNTNRLAYPRRCPDECRKEEAAKTLKYEVLNMCVRLCATPSGYGERIVQKRRAIASLVVNEDEARATEKALGRRMWERS